MPLARNLIEIIGLKAYFEVYLKTIFKSIIKHQ
jgi:hypothetical protein